MALEIPAAAAKGAPATGELTAVVNTAAKIIDGPEESLAKKIVVEGRPLIFDHDYATEVVQKRKAYNGIKKLLKEKGIRFQTPLTKMRIHWDDGPKLYGSAQEAACDMRKRGFSVGPTGLAAPDHEATLERLQQAMPWQRVGERRGNSAACKGKYYTLLPSHTLCMKSRETSWPVITEERHQLLTSHDYTTQKPRRTINLLSLDI
ncbi:hypothetical protein F7725_016132 [Dissostichus mawsoni]|uniref:Uncharacterized protein n=1 Tax=Dissostichus mawsoni TaxID=36200 RepID=A0A7J5Y3R4_DISMA|nr:hypothetical protein F7725_016132 [Dissostichus mawsoni]